MKEDLLPFFFGFSLSCAFFAAPASKTWPESWGWVLLGLSVGLGLLVAVLFRGLK